ncbi:MAG: hypothetical protein IKZ08_02550 [Bacteroidales bacterium]|nr:hypothetical protein [Bacteroidales bacterium]
MSNCLYNGIELPAPPNNDIATYPREVVVLSDDTVRLYAFSDYAYAYTSRPYVTINTPKRVWSATYDATNKTATSDWEELTDFTVTGVSQLVYFDTLLWSNFDILDSGDRVYLAGSEPVHILGPFDLKSWLIGLIVGLVEKPMLLNAVKKEPIAYLYNGVQLPKLPEWDKEQYPYAAVYYGIYYSDYPEYGPEEPIYRAGFVAADQPLFVAESNTKRLFYCKNPVSFISCYAMNDDDKIGVPATHWGDLNSTNRDYADDLAEIGVSAYLVLSIKHNHFGFKEDQVPQWTNHDIYNLATDELYLAKSGEPIPVYE